MHTIHTLSLTCKEATAAASLKTEGKITIVMSIRLWIHFISCPPCKRFMKQIRLILKRIRLYPESAPLEQLSGEKKQRIQEMINTMRTDKDAEF